MSNFNLKAFIRESNRIEGLNRCTEADIEAHEYILDADEIDLTDLQHFVNLIEPGAKLRSVPGMNVRIDGYHPPPGGKSIPHYINKMVLHVANLDPTEAPLNAPYEVHLLYEAIHPFMDGNGRSGRVLWMWMMKQRGRMTAMPFLQSFYYAALNDSRSYLIKALTEHMELTYKEDENAR